MIPIDIERCENCDHKGAYCELYCKNNADTNEVEKEFRKDKI